MPVIRKLRKLYTDDKTLVQLQAHLTEVFDGLRLCDLLEGNLVRATLSTADTQIPHNLGRTPRGWLIADKTANEDVWRDSWDKTFITLTASGAVDVVLWVF